MKKIIEYINLLAGMKLRMKVIGKYMSLSKVSEVYAECVCSMHKWPSKWIGGASEVFCEVSFAFVNGYIKALHDNGMKMENGLVVKQNILEYIPSGSVDEYIKKELNKNNENSAAILRQVLKKYGMTNSNINIIVENFVDTINENKNSNCTI